MPRASPGEPSGEQPVDESLAADAHPLVGVAVGEAAERERDGALLEHRSCDRPDAPGRAAR